jgi:hypothetical protein
MFLESKPKKKERKDSESKHVASILLTQSALNFFMHVMSHRKLVFVSVMFICLLRLINYINY